MKVFSWLQNKLSGCHGCKKSHSIATDCEYHLLKLQESHKEEFSNWPDELLAIGTFGNDEMKQHPEIITDHPQHDSINITSTNNVFPDDDALPLQLEEAAHQDHLITSEEYLEKVERLLNEEPITEMTNDYQDLTTDNYKSLVLPRKGTKDVDGANKKTAIVKRTASFLLKKMLCKSGFSTTRPLPSLRDPPSCDPRMEKILRAILNKKIYPQGTSQGATLYSKRYIENNRRRPGLANDEEFKEANNLVDKWVKTDSECRFRYCSRDMKPSLPPTGISVRILGP